MNRREAALILGVRYRMLVLFYKKDFMLDFLFKVHQVIKHEYAMLIDD